MHIIGVANQKGGVGKTTTVHNLGVGLSLKGIRVLLVDLDPQANLSDSCGIRLTREDPSTMQVLDGVTPIQEAIKPVNLCLDLLPGHLALAGADNYFATAIRREERLKDALDSLDKLENGNPYQVIILDCPPTLGVLVQNAFRTMNRLLIPVQCEYHALEGLNLLEECLSLYSKSKLLRPDFSILGVLPTIYDSRKNICRDALGLLTERQGERMLKTIIRDNVQLAEAPSNGLDIFAHAPKSFGSQDYQSLADEVCQKLKL